MPSCLPVFPDHNKTKYYIQKTDDGHFMVVSKDGDWLLTISRTYDRAAKHIMSSTGKWPRCVHEWERVRIFTDHWNTGKSVNTGKEMIDAYKCEVCGTYKKIKRLTKRVYKRPRQGGAINSRFRGKKGKREIFNRREHRRKIFRDMHKRDL